MSYAVGGLGISHADVGDLEAFVLWLGSTRLVPAEFRDDVVALADKEYGSHSGILYDQLRAAGICSPPVASSDLLGEHFNHFHAKRTNKYCRNYKNNDLTPKDWLVFRTWARRALRTEEGQQWLLEL